MATNADISGAFQRPTLIDYLIVLELEPLEVCLQIHIGALEAGMVAVRRGAVVRAELPGASGDAALRMLARLPNARISPQVWIECDSNVGSSWRELVEVADQALGRRQRLSMVRAELRELDADLAAESGVYAIPRPGPGPAELRVQRTVAEIFDWATIDTYLAGDIEGARELAQQRGQLCPSEAIPTANVERLQMRLLDDEIAAGVEEVAQ